MLPVPDHVPVAGSYSSAEFPLGLLPAHVFEDTPPATRTFPSPVRAATWPARPWVVEPAADHVFVTRS